MAGDHNSGRKPIENYKFVKSFRIKESLIISIKEISEHFDLKESEIVENALEGYIRSINKLIKNKEL